MSVFPLNARFPLDLIAILRHVRKLKMFFEAIIMEVCFTDQEEVESDIKGESKVCKFSLLVFTLHNLKK